MISTKDGTKAPGVYINSADYINFMISYFEFISKTGLGTNGTLPTVDAAEFHLGYYPSIDESVVYVNPSIATSGIFTGWPQYSNIQAYNIKDPNTVPAGSWGTAIYYPGNPGIFEDTLYSTDSSYI